MWRYLIPRFRLRKALRLGPFIINLTQRGLSSISLRRGRGSWNSRTKRVTYDTPGPGSLTFGGKS
jgi:hypothetical protein